MKLAILILSLASTLSAGPGTEFDVSRSGKFLILHEVYVNGGGPFRMMIDTGNASSLIRPSVARKLGLIPNGWLVQSTAAGDRRVPAAVLDELRAGNVIDNNVEVMIGNVLLPGVDGVLGQSWLVRHDYLLDYKNHKLVVDGPAPAGGVRMALLSPDGCPAVSAVVNGRSQELIVDSGADQVVLFDGPAGLRQAALITNFSSVAVSKADVIVAIGEGYRRKMTAAHLHMPGRSLGLLPAGSFASVYISNRDGEVVLVP